MPPREKGSGGFKGALMARGASTAMGGKGQGRRRWATALHSLQFKASLLVVLLVMAITAAALIVSTRLAGQALHSQACQQTREWADSLASSTANDVEQGDAESLVRTINDLIWTRGVACVAFADLRGEVIASGEKHPGQLGAYGPRSRLQIDQVGRPLVFRPEGIELTCVEVIVPVSVGTPIPGRQWSSRKVVGYLHLAVDVSPAQAALEHMAAELTRIALAAMLLVVPCSLLITRRVVAPLNELSRTARALASGAMEARARVSSQSEIGALAVAFNDMAGRLAESQLEMLRFNSELEQRVHQRTCELEELAARDALTGLYNRRYFAETMAREFAAAERYDTDMTCLMFDLDHFKAVNDRYGHAAGDEVLTAMSDCIAREMRESDVAARFGGDEFIVLLPRTSAQAAGRLAERIVQRFNTYADDHLKGIPATASVGIASRRSTRPTSAEALIHQADTALYSAKQAGRNRAVEARCPDSERIRS